MYKFSGVALWNNGQYEGFIGTSLVSAKDAEKRAISRAQSKADDFRITFKWISEATFKTLPSSVQNEIKLHWKIDQE